MNRASVAVALLACATAPLAAQNPTVDVTRVVARVSERMRTLPGEFTPFESVALYARVSGFVDRVLVDRGSLVKRGQTLATIEAPELVAGRAEAEAKLAAAKSQHVEAQARLVAARNTYEGLKAASKTPGAVAENELVQAEQAVDAVQALVTSLDAQAKAAAAASDAVAQLERYLKITAPFDGVITERNVHPGALVGPGTIGTPLLRLEQNRRLRLVVSVPEADVGGIVRGTDVTFKVPAFPGETFHGTIARFAASMDAKTRTMAVELDVTNADARLAAGMYPEVRWPIKNARAALVVPKTSVVTTTERVFVIRVRDGKAQWVDVRKGAADKDTIEVIGDLQAGDSVVVRASDEIRDGSALMIRGRS